MPGAHQLKSTDHQSEQAARSMVRDICEKPARVIMHGQHNMNVPRRTYDPLEEVKDRLDDLAMQVAALRDQLKPSLFITGNEAISEFLKLPKK